MSVISYAMKNAFLLFTFCIFLSLSNKAQTVTDIEGNVYHTITIGTQTWMVENLMTTRYNDGSPIPMVTSTYSWGNATTPGYCWYNNDAAANKTTYGALYNWYAVNSGKLAPAGWHCPSAEEWHALINYLGGDSIAGGMMKETGFSHWLSPNTGATNSSGYTALPGGIRDEYGVFDYNGNTGGWWSTTEYSSQYTGFFAVYTIYKFITEFGESKKFGASVRCIKDNSSAVGNSYPSTGLKAYPNPFSDQIFIDVPDISRTGMITIYDLNGKILFRDTIQQVIHVGSLPCGLYILEVSDSQSVYRKKLLKICDRNF